MIWRVLGVIAAIAVIAIAVNASFAMLAESYAASFRGEDGALPERARVLARFIRGVGVICIVFIGLLMFAWAFG